MQLKKIALAVCGALSLAASGSAMADQYPDFQIDATAYGGKMFTADRIAGIYEEEILFTPTGANGGNFNVSLRFNANSFVHEGANVLVGQSGLNLNYGLYALFLGSGTYTLVGGAPSFQLNPAGSQFSAWIDADLDSTGPGNTWTIANAASLWTQSAAGQADDVQVAFGVGLNGQGAVTCTTSGNSCGSFLQNTSFVPTAGAGTSFFAGPSPFYSVSLQSGDLNGIDPATTTRIRGEMDVVFVQPVPEPASLALVGLALAGVAVARRKKA